LKPWILEVLNRHPGASRKRLSTAKLVIHFAVACVLDSKGKIKVDPGLRRDDD
jgi:hypothetical protein